MKMNISNYNENLLLNWALTTASVVRPTSWYVGLFSDSPGLLIDEPTNELMNQDYSRQTTSFSIAALGSVSNNSVASFYATTTWSTVSYLGIFDAESSGNLLFWGGFNIPRFIYPFETLNFSNNTIKIFLN
jgi:hypothetical protein